MNPSNQATTATVEAHPAQTGPRLDARDALGRVLDLIRGCRGVEDIDAARLREVFGVEFHEHAGRLGFGERVSREWWTAFEWDPAHPYGPRFEFSFRPDLPGSHPDAGDICTIDAEAFAAELAAMGFAREIRRAEHGRPIREDFERPGMTVEVYARGEADAPPEKISHACVQRVCIL